MAQWMIFDLGASETRGGPIEDAPRARFPSCIGVRPGTDHVRYADSCKPDEDTILWPFQAGRPPTEQEWPKEVNGAQTPKLKGLIEDWFQYSIMNELREDPSENALLLVVNEPNWTRQIKTQIADILLGTMEWQGLACVPSAVCFLRAHDKSSGLVIDIGASGFRVNAVKSNKIVASGSGRHLPANANPSTFRFEDPGCLFNPPSGDGLAKVVATVLEAGGQGFDNILLCGGGSAVPGLKDRLVSELKTQGKSLDSFTISVSSHRHANFKGAAKIMEDGSFEDAAVAGDYTNLDLQL